MKRTLTLRREALTELTGAELVSVAGGGAQTQDGLTCPLLYCPEGVSAHPRCSWLCPTTD